jgi:hypothetical protein
LQQEPDLFVRALEEVYRSHPQGWEHIELIKRWETSPGKYKIHVPGLVAPYEKYFRKMRPTDPDVLDITKQGYAGWYYKPHSCGFGLAVKKLGPDEWQVSGAMFLRAIIPDSEMIAKIMKELESMKLVLYELRIRVQRK